MILPVSKKSHAIASLIAEWVPPTGNEAASRFDPHYLGFFECFNRQKYYEAHDVLEELWLKTKGPLHGFYKGLIQTAGAFVHLQKSRLNPASRLFHLALNQLAPFAPISEGLNVENLTARITEWVSVLEKSDYTVNPYHPQHPPTLRLEDSHEV